MDTQEEDVDALANWCYEVMDKMRQNDIVDRYEYDELERLLDEAFHRDQASSP